MNNIEENEYWRDFLTECGLDNILDMEEIELDAVLDEEVIDD